MMNYLLGRTKSISRYFTLLLILVIAQLYIHVASAQVPTPDKPTDDEVNAIAKQLYCPVCENTPLDVCPTQACAEWRELIREKLAEGWSEEQIKQYFVERYGDRVMAIPPPRGLNWLIYFVPPMAFLVGAYLLYRAFISWGLISKRISPLTIPEESAESHHIYDEFTERLEEELRKL